MISLRFGKNGEDVMSAKQTARSDVLAVGGGFTAAQTHTTIRVLNICNIWISAALFIVKKLF